MASIAPVRYSNRHVENALSSAFDRMKLGIQNESEDDYEADIEDLAPLARQKRRVDTTLVPTLRSLKVTRHLTESSLRLGSKRKVC